MNSKKNSLIVLSCLLLIDNFQILGSDNAKEQEMSRKGDVKVCCGDKVTYGLLFGVIFSALYWAGLKDYNDKVSFCACVDNGGGFNCANGSRSLLHPSSVNEDPQDAVMRCTVDQGARVLMPWHDDPSARWFLGDPSIRVKVKCDEGFYPSSQDAKKACEYKLRRAEKKCEHKVAKEFCSRYKLQYKLSKK